MPSLPENALSPPLALSASAMKTILVTSLSGVNVESKIGVMVSILLASLFAVSFPAISIEIPFLQIPPIVFFIGKHFGTGVILATAFIHLLDEAFRSLQNPILENRYGKTGRWAGLIILASLLAIFLVEYVSTSYVDHLRKRPPTASESTTPFESSPKLFPRDVYISPSHPPTRSPSIKKHIATIVSETTPLLPSNPDRTALTTTSPCVSTESPAPFDVQTFLRPSSLSTSFSHSQSVPHPTMEPHPTGPHHSHHHVPHKLSTHPVVDFIEVLTNSPRICRLGLSLPGEHQHHHHHHHHHDHDHQDDTGRTGGCLSRCPSVVRLVDDEQAEGEDYQRHSHIHDPQPTMGRKRQVISILVLQLGIMIHSFVIGITLAIASGSDFTSLTTAIIFHQLFEGLSLGIRIAAIPPAERKDVVQPLPEDHARDGTSTPGNSSPPNKGHQHENRSYRVSSKKWKLWHSWRAGEIHWLKPTLSFFFACTTPFGMALGLAVFGSGRTRDDASMLLIKGVMSAISAGMLIYAATVEMIAGDFVFGDVEGSGHHHHHHDVRQHEAGLEIDGGGHLDGVEPRKRGRSHEQSQIRNDGETLLHGSGPRSPSRTLEDEGSTSVETAHSRQASVGKRVLAVVSLLMGVGMMVVAALGE